MIRVPCVCGKTYRVPLAKAGRKLQCRRCGATQRIPVPEEDDDMLVPFEVLESDEGPLPPSRQDTGLKLALPDDEDEPPARRDRPRKRKSKTGVGRVRRDRGEPEERDSSKRESAIQQPERSALRRLAMLARSSWWALTPAGIVWGPVIAVQTRGLEARLGNAVKARAQLHQVLLTAWSGALLWGLVAVFGALRAASAVPEGTPAGGNVATVNGGGVQGGAGQGTDPDSGAPVGVGGPSERLREVQGEAHPLRRLLVLAWADPEAALKAEALEAELGAPLGKTVAIALNDKRPAVRLDALRLAQRVDLGLGSSELDRLAKDPDYGVRREVSNYLRARGNGDWARTLLTVATSDSGLQAALAREEVFAAVKDKATALTILRGAGEVRRDQGRGETDDPILMWPEASLPNAVAHLSDPTAKAEAYVVLHSAGPSAVGPLVDEAAKLGATSRQREALILLAELAAEGVCSLRVFLDAVGSVNDEAQQGVALQALSDRVRVPSEELVGWVLEVLRTKPRSSLARQLAPLLAPVGFAPGTDVAWLVRDFTLPGDHRGLLKELFNPRRAGDPAIDRELRRTWGKLRDAEVRQRVVELAHSRLFTDSLELVLDAMTDRELQVRALATRLMDQPVAPEPEPFRKKAAQVIASRLRVERDEDVLKSLYALATGGRFGWLKDKRNNSEYELSNSLREALRQNARKGHIEAVRALASHPSEKTLKVLVEVLDRVREQEVRSAAMNALNKLSGWRKATDNPSHWKESLQPLPAAVKTVLETYATTDRRAREATASRATARLAEAEADFQRLVSEAVSGSRR